MAVTSAANVISIEQPGTRTGVPFNVWLTIAGVATAPLSYDMEGLGFRYDSDRLTVGFEGVLNNDHKYTPSVGHMRGRYFDLWDGRVEARFSTISVTAGRLVHRDEVPGPYSLFVSGADRAATVVDARYDDGLFFYGTRWIELNRQSSLYTYQQTVYDDLGDPIGSVEVPLDRGANYKVYGLHLGNFRFGLQESVVYIYRSFYPEYFLSPLPMYFTQLVNSSFGKPWTQLANENSIMGIFGDYTWDNAFAYGQFLIDDWNEMGLEFLVPGEWLNPAKFAWSLGGIIQLNYGTLGLFHAGATKYTFQSTYAGDDETDVPSEPYYRYFNWYPYSYTYYPETEYETRDGWKPILPQDNYIGYQHGENNLAFTATFSAEAFGIDYDASLEYTISGSKSPANPWHEDDWHAREGTKMFDDERLEHRLLLEVTAGRWFGPLRLTGALELGGVWNELQLESVSGAPDQSRIFLPSEERRFLWSVSLQLQYLFGLGSRQQNLIQNER
jgi:hypothetical protein